MAVTQTVYVNIVVKGMSPTGGGGDPADSIHRIRNAAESAGRANDFLTRTFMTMQKALMSMLIIVPAWFFLITLPEKIIGGMIGALKAVIKFGEEVNRTITTTAGLLASFASFGPTAGESFEGALKVSQKLQFVFAELSATSLATAQDIQKTFQMFVARGGLAFSGGDVEKAARTAALLTNIVTAFTGGVQLERQLITETSALMEGQARAGATVAKIIQAQVGNLKDWIEQQKRAGTLFESLSKMFAGVAEASNRLGQTLTGSFNTIKGMAEIINNIVFQSGAFPVLGRLLVGIRETLRDAVKELGNIKSSSQTLSPTLETILKGFAALNVAIINVVESLKAMLQLIFNVENTADAIETIALAIMKTANMASTLFATISHFKIGLWYEEMGPKAKTMEQQIELLDNVTKKLGASGAVADDKIAALLKDLADVKRVINEAEYDQFGQMVNRDTASYVRGMIKRIDEAVVAALDVNPFTTYKVFDDRSKKMIDEMIKSIKANLAKSGASLLNLFAGGDEGDAKASNQIERLIRRMMNQVSDIMNKEDPIMKALGDWVLRGEDAAEALSKVNAQLREQFDIANMLLLKAQTKQGIDKETRKTVDIFVAQLEKERNAQEQINDILLQQEVKYAKQKGFQEQAAAERAALMDTVLEKVRQANFNSEQMETIWKRIFAIINSINTAWDQKQFLQDIDALRDKAKGAISSTQGLNQQLEFLRAHGLRTNVVFEQYIGSMEELKGLQEEVGAAIGKVYMKLLLTEKAMRGPLRDALRELLLLFKQLGEEASKAPTEHERMMQAMQDAITRCTEAMAHFVRTGQGGMQMLKDMATELALTIAQNLGQGLANAFTALFSGEGFKGFLKALKNMIGQSLIAIGTKAVFEGAIAIAEGILGLNPSHIAAGAKLIALGTAAIAAGAAMSGGGSNAPKSAAGTASSGSESKDQTIYMEPYFQRQNNILNQLNSTINNVNGTLNSFDTKSPGIVVKEGAPQAVTQITNAVTTGLQTSTVNRNQMNTALAGGTY